MIDVTEFGMLTEVMEVLYIKPPTSVTVYVTGGKALLSVTDEGIVTAPEQSPPTPDIAHAVIDAVSGAPLVSKVHVKVPSSKVAPVTAA